MVEQYWTPRRLDFKHLRMCLDNYTAGRLFIRDAGSRGGTTHVDESLEGKTLDFRKDKSGLSFLIDSNEVFHFPLKERGTRKGDGFSVAYERIGIINGEERHVMLGTGIDPYNETLPEPRRSILVHDIDHYFVQIFFKGRIHLKFHSWYQKPHWKYWSIAKER